MYPYGLVGNCQVSALVKNNGSIDWLCFPRPDSPPVFGRLLDPDGGYFHIAPSLEYSSKQHYETNTNILTTEVTLSDDSKFIVTDFCPRFLQHGRTYRPNSLFRIVDVVRGSPKVKVICRPISGWDKNLVPFERGNSHLRWDIRGDSLRLVTNMPITYLAEESEFHIKESLYFGITWSLGIEEDLPTTANRFLEQTRSYWRSWIKHCHIPPYFQKEIIRSALALKLHCYEDTGAILAALTTGLPEVPGGVRNWDYRFCWLRDAYFSLSAFRNLNHFEEMEGFLKFLLSIVANHEQSHERLSPVYRLDQSLPLPEQEHSNWQGWMNARPVRTGNQAAEHIQNDVYGEMLLTLAPIFRDERFYHLRTREHEELLQYLVKQATKNISKADAGLWELRNKWQEHTFSNLMTWAGLDRIYRIANQGGFSISMNDLEGDLRRAYDAVLKSRKNGVLGNGPEDESLDSALLQAAILRFPDSQASSQTVDKIKATLGFSPHSAFLYRYLRPDDFGRPESAFLICSFWLVQALAKCGKSDEAFEIMDAVLPSANAVGLFSEHFDPAKKMQTGNFPQAYSHVGLINAAFALSPAWDEI